MRRTQCGTPVAVAVPRSACGEFPTTIFDIVLKRITVRGSIVGTRQDLAEALAFAAEGKVQAHFHRVALDDVNDVFSALRSGQVDGRMVLDMALPQATGFLRHTATSA